jgi:hypothetical protein
VLTADKDTNVAANWQAEEGGHPSGEAGLATKRKANHAAHQGGGTCSPQVSTGLFGPKNQGRTRQRGSTANFLPAPRKAGDAEAWPQAKRGHKEENQGKTGQGGSAADFLPAPRKAGDPHAEAWLAWLQARRARKEAAHAAAQRKTNHSATQEGRMCSPQVSTALFGSTVGKFQGETRQRGSAANFLPAPRKGRSAAGFLPATGTPYEKEAAIAQGARGPRHRWSLAASTKDKDPPNNTGMAKLGQNMSVPGTTAAQFADWAWKEKAVPGWGGNGANYRACVEAIPRGPNPLATALGPEAARRIYLAMVNGDGFFLVLHNLARFEEPAGMRSQAGGHIVVFKGEVRDDFGLPRLLQFDKSDNKLFALDSFPMPALHSAALFYHQDEENDLRFHNKVVPFPPGGPRYSCHRYQPNGLPGSWIIRTWVPHSGASSS